MEEGRVEVPAGLSNGELLFRELKDSIYDVYSLEQLRYKGLRSGADPIITRPLSHIPDFGTLVDIEQIADTVTWSFTIPAEIEESVSVSSSKRETPRHLKYKIRHEFVAEGLDQGSTDKRLSDYFPVLMDDEDILTPDIIVTDALGVIHVIEIATTRCHDLRQIERVFREKHFKYEQALLNRSLTIHDPITYTPIVVCQNAIVSNIPIPSRLVDELVIRMRIALALENCALSKGFLIQRTEDEELLSMSAKEISLSLSNIKDYQKRGPEKIYITNPFIAKVRQDPVEQNVSDAYAFSRLEAKKESLSRRTTVATTDEYFIKLNETTNRRQDIKPVFPIPGIIPPNTASTTIPLRRAQGVSGPHAPLIKMWNEALDICNRPNSEWKEENIAELEKEAMTTSKSTLQEMIRKRHERRSKYHVASLKTSMDSVTNKYLAKDGVMAKRFSNSVFLKERRKRQKLSFSGLTNTQDITDFIEDLTLLDECKIPMNEPTKLSLDLLTQAGKMAANSRLTAKHMVPWCESRLFKYLDLCSDIAMELCISFKSNTDRDSFIVKKLKYHDVYLLIKTTNSRSHIFVSLFYPTPNDCDVISEGPLGNVIRTNSAYITPFMSFRADKLENIACAPAKFLSFVSFWSNFYDLDVRDKASFSKHDQAVKMLSLSMLILLEDKAETEQSATLTRYMYMEIFKGDLTMLLPDPFKMLSKFTSAPRSRLNLFLIKEIMSNFSKMLNKPPLKVTQKSGIRLSEGEDFLPSDEWIGLLNCFTGQMIPNASKAINLCYIGYLKNKNEVGQDNSDYQLIEKVLEEEISLDLTDKEACYGAYRDKKFPGSKQFSSDCIVKGCKIMENRLKNVLGSGWLQILEKEILENLARCLTTEIATLKASSPFSHEKFVKTVNKKDNEEIHRLRVMEAISIKLSLFQVNPMENLTTFIEIIESSIAGVIADLFKKNQHGGLREIYVLTIESRVLQLFIETLSRTICSYFEEETLTHPENKLHILDKHKVRSAKISRATNSIYVDLCNSSDKQRWNQNFVMTAMSIPLFRMTTPLFHNAIKRILNLWADKLIKIPPAVCDLLMDKISLSSETYMNLLENFWKPRTKRATRSYIMGLCGSFINTTTGMMQGILHYLSSLLHLTFLHAGSFYTKALLRAKYPKNRFTMSQVCSSDDSACILSTFSEPDLEKLTKTNFLAFIDSEISLLTLTKFCHYFCMRESPKSTIALPDYVEFNSEFILRNTIAKPVIKINAACVTVTESESYITRFHTMYNLITDLSSSGFPSINSMFCQMAQGMLHYKTMGSSTNGLFPLWKKDISEFPSCTHGFFLLDSDLCCGLMGFSYVRWTSYTSHPLLYKSISAVDMSELEPTPDGGIAPSLVVKHGDLKKWHTLMDRIDNSSLKPANRVLSIDKANQRVIIDERILKMRQDKINSNHELLFRPARTIPEVKIKLLMKASMPGVARSLGKGCPFLQALAMSVYSINTHCFTKTSITFEATKGVMKKGKVTEKVSLLLDLRREMRKVKEMGEGDEDTDKLNKMMMTMFPLIKRYEEAAQIIDSFSGALEIPVHRIRNRKTLIIIQPKMIDLPVSLFKACGKKWFGYVIKTSDRILERCWNHYKVIFPWLGQDFESTLQNGPFQTAIELYYFISKQDIKARKFMLNGPGLYSNIFEGQLRQLIRKSSVSGHILETGSTLKVKKRTHEASLARLSLALQIPLSKVRYQHVVETLKNVKDRVEDIQTLSAHGKKEAKLLLLAGLCKGELNESEIINILNQTEIGTLTSFTKLQYRVGKGKKAKWRGVGECLVFTEGVMLKVEILDDVAVKISTNRWRLLRSNPSILRNALEDLGLRTNRKPGIWPGAEAMFQGIRYGPLESVGTPVYHDKTLQKVYLEPKDVIFNVSKERVGLYSKIRSLMKPLIELNSSIRDCPTGIVQSSGTTLWNSWVEFRSVSPDSIYKFLKTLKEKQDEFDNPSSKAKPDDEWATLKNWIKSTLESRLKYMGLGYTYQDFTTTVLESDQAEDEIEDEELNAFLMDLICGDTDDDLKDILSLMEGQVKEREKQKVLSIIEEQELIDEELEKIQEGDFYDESETYELFSGLFHNWESETPILESSIYKSTTFDYLYLHPLWDEMIKTCNKMDPAFFTKLLQGIVVSSDEEFSKILMSVMGIRKQSKELNITQRFSRLSIGEDYFGEKLNLTDINKIHDPIDMPLLSVPGPSGLQTASKAKDKWWDMDESDSD